MPPAFDYPRGTDVWTTVGPVLAAVAERPEWSDERSRSLGVLVVVGRLKAGVSLQEAESQLTGIVRQLHEEYTPSTSGHRSIHILSLVEHALGRTRPALFALWGAVGLVLLLVCSNVAGLLLVREASRAKEHALRLALGAGRLRIVRQMLLEAGVVTVAGGAAGLLLAQASLGLFAGLSPVEIPRLEEVALDSDVLGFVAILIAATVALVCLAPAAQFASPKVAALLGDAARGSSESRRGTVLRRWLVAAQIALAFILLVGASLMARSFFDLLRADLGFEPRNLLTFNLDLPEDTYPTHEAKRTFYRELLRRVESLPGVVAVAGTSNRPFRGDEIGVDVTYHVEGQTETDREQNPRAIGFVVTTDYFRTMNIRLLRGRTFTQRDDARAERVIVISESLARQAWPGQDPIGKGLCCGWSQNGDSPWLTVIGVVENARYRDVHEPRLDIYGHYLRDGAPWPASSFEPAPIPCRWPGQYARSLRRSIRSVRSKPSQRWKR